MHKCLFLIGGWDFAAPPPPSVAQQLIAKLRSTTFSVTVKIYTGDSRWHLLPSSPDMHSFIPGLLFTPSHVHSEIPLVFVSTEAQALSTLIQIFFKWILSSTFEKK